MTVPSLKPEYPPLLECGMHEATLETLRILCVDNPRFALSKRRKMLMGLLDEVATGLAALGVKGELWVNGSFLTEKIDPDDVDLILRADGEFYDNASSELQIVMDAAENLCAKPEHCHCFLHASYAEESHPLYWLSRYMDAYWLKQWGFARQDHLKGIALLKLQGGAK